MYAAQHTSQEHKEHAKFKNKAFLYSTRLETSSMVLEPLVQMPSVLARSPYIAMSEELSDEPPKMQCFSAGQRRNAMAKSMLAVANAMIYLSPPLPETVRPSNNDPQVEAIVYIQKQGGLTESEFGEAFDIIVVTPQRCVLVRRVQLVQDKGRMRLG